MDYKDEIMGEIADNIGYFDMLELLKQTEKIEDMFDELLENLSDKDLIEMFEDYCYDYDEFLEIKEMCGYEINNE